MNILKELLSFDDSPELYKHKGGAAAVVSMAAKNPEVAGKLAGAAGDAAGAAGAGDAAGATGGDKEEKKVDAMEDESLMDEIGNFWAEIVEIVKDNFKRVYNVFIGWVLTPIMFGSVAPALPFFLVMGVLFAIFKFLMQFFRKL